MKTRKRSRFLCAAIAITLSPWPIAALQAAEPTDGQRRPAPPLEVYTFDGRSVKIERLKDKIVVVDFMTTVCPACKMASDGLQKLYRELGPKGFTPVAVALNTNEPLALKAYAREHRLTFALGNTARANVVSFLNYPPDKLMLVPTLVLVDRQGQITSIETGWKGEDAMRASIVRLLSEQ